MIVLGEILSFLAAITLAYSTFSKKKNKMMLIQALNALFFCFSNLCLAGYSAVVTNALTLVRDLMAAKNKLDKKYAFIIAILMIGIGLYVNNRGLIGLLPIIASVQYTICIYLLKSTQHIRWALIVNLSLWMIFDFSVMAYPAFIMDVTIIIVSFINIVRYSKNSDLKVEPKEIEL